MITQRRVYYAPSFSHVSAGVTLIDVGKIVDGETVLAEDVPPNATFDYDKKLDRFVVTCAKVVKSTKDEGCSGWTTKTESEYDTDYPGKGLV